MEKEELDKIKEQSDEVIRGVVALQEEIKKYKSGAESFEIATGVLAQVAEREKEVTLEIKKLMAQISKSNMSKMIENLGEIEEKMENVRGDFEEIEKRLMAQQREEKKIEREMKELRAEMTEMKDLLIKNKEKKGGIRGLFGKR